MKKNTRSDKKFLVKVWVPSIDKSLFRQHCFEAHLSMMSVGEIYLSELLKDSSDEELSLLIENNLQTYNKLDKQKSFEPLGIRLKNNEWQKIAFFAVTYHSTVAKIASCFFNHGIGSFEMRNVISDNGLRFINRRNKGLDQQELQERVSDF